jgi:Bacteriophage tail sheath protein
VRRLVTMIEEAIEESVPWSVFEPNDTALWGELDRVVRAFLDNLWRRGMLDGPTAEDAFFVRCDETTNPPEERDAGRMWCLVGLQPPWPAEFVIVRIGNATGAARGIPDAESADA